MKVLHVITGLPQAAGTSVFCMEVCDGLSRLGVEAAIAVQQTDREGYPSREKTRVLDASAGFDGIGFKPDIVHIHALWSPFLHRAAVWARRASLPIVHSPHGMLTPWALRAKWYKKLVALAAYQYGDLRMAGLLHATAPSEVEDIRRIGLRQPVAVIPLGIHPPRDEDRRPSRDVKTALFVSRVHPKKGLLNLVKAWACVRPAGWRMVIAGPDQDGYSAKVQALAERLGIVQDFCFMGPVYGPEKEALYADADLFILPTFSENFGVVVIEALAHGCPVITTKGAPWSELMGSSGSPSVLADANPVSSYGNLVAGDWPAQDPVALHPQELTRTGRCGWWVDIGVEPLVNALTEAMSLPDGMLRAMGREGRRLVRQRYSWSNIAQQMKKAYERV